MGRDFANKGRPTRNPRPSNSNTYHWSWLLAGTAIGFVISAIAYFKLFPILSTHLVEVAVEET
ncbi:MAG TPA: hypothetical protein VI522_06065, partial [Gammaproteobacteria bacterium]|nr:hypothetical protein [Gammaproteobacteria bacterium]